MSRANRSRWWAAGCVAAAAVPAAAQPPAQFPKPAVEFYYGVTRVTDPTLPTAPADHPSDGVVPASLAVAADPADQPGQALVGALHAVRDGSASVSHAARNVLDRLADRVMRPPSTPTFVFAYPPPGTYPAPAAAPTAPQVVVVREPASDAAPAAGTPLVAGLLMAVGGLAVGTGLVGAALVRGRRAAPPVVIPVPAAAAPTGPTLKLLGEYDAGALPESAEKFEVGPTFQEEKAQAEKAKADSEKAVVQFILDQNLKLWDAKA